LGDAAYRVSSFGAATYPFKMGLAGPYFEWVVALGLALQRGPAPICQASASLFGGNNYPVKLSRPDGKD
jgi:hypothetical protein